VEEVVVSVDKSIDPNQAMTEEQKLKWLAMGFEEHTVAKDPPTEVCDPVSTASIMRHLGTLNERAAKRVLGLDMGVAEPLDYYTIHVQVPPGFKLDETTHEGLAKALQKAADTYGRPESILDEAARITSTDRQQAYGHPLDNHSTTAEFWTSYGHRKGWLPLDKKLTFEDVCDFNALQKLSREANAPKRDNSVDVCGFQQNKIMAREEQARRDPNNGTGRPL
jgi:hypothetical protein